MEHRGLNPQQLAAVRHGDGPLLILAGAGTGKTRTLTHRIADLIDRGVDPATILAVAFTNKAADELRERVRSLLGRKTAMPSVSTFHSFCVRVLRRDIGLLGYHPGFTIYDAGDQLAAVREAARESSLAARDLDVKRLQAIISRARNEGGDPDPGDGADEYRVMAASLAPRYASIMRSYNALDFDDLLLLTLRIFDQHPEALAWWKNRARHVLVDEFQDTNSVQYRIVARLAAPEGNLTVVGDDDQSIYAWRGAVPENLLSFTVEWPGARVVTLDQNYRSPMPILAAAHDIIAGVRRRREKRLWSTRKEGRPVVVMACRDAEDEAAVAVERLLEVLADKKTRPGDCAVLFRTNAQSRPFEDVLRVARLRYVVVGGMRFYDRREVKDFLAYLAALANPLDEVSLLRVVNNPPRGIGRETVLRLHELSLAGKVPLREMMGRAATVPGVGERQSAAIAHFLELLERWRGRFVSGRLAEAAAGLMSEIGMEDAVARSSKNPEVGMRRVENLREVIAALAAYCRDNPSAGLDDYLATAALTGREEEAEGENGDGAVVLMTMHAAKGLEFDHVVLTGLEEGLLPHRRSEDEQGGLDEERRLLYVGMTRARKTLLMTHAAERMRRETPVAMVSSRFLEDLPETVERRDRRTPIPSTQEEDDQAATAFFGFLGTAKD